MLRLLLGRLLVLLRLLILLGRMRRCCLVGSRSLRRWGLHRSRGSAGVICGSGCLAWITTLLWRGGLLRRVCGLGSAVACLGGRRRTRK